MAGAVRPALGMDSGFRSALGWYPLDIRCMVRLSKPGRGCRCVESVFWMELLDWLWMGYGDPARRMSLKFWFIRLSTLVRRDSASASE